MWSGTSRCLRFRPTRWIRRFHRRPRGRSRKSWSKRERRSASAPWWRASTRAAELPRLPHRPLPSLPLHHDLDQGGVAAMVPYGVGDQPELGGEFAGDDAVVALIPVQRHALLVAAGGKVPVDPDRFAAAWNRDQNRPGLDWLKAVSRQAILRRVGSLPVALRLEERDK